jgi:hypothetical protein
MARDCSRVLELPVRAAVGTSGPVVSGDDGGGEKGGRRCGGHFDLRGHPGIIRCELLEGHSSRFHHNSAEGYEWSDGMLWPLPKVSGRARRVPSDPA